MRFDLNIIASWIDSDSRVLDLGCGSGELLLYLKENKNVVGVGVEKNEKKATEAISKGLTILHGDIAEEVLDYGDNSFDYVILSQTLQQVCNPDRLLKNLSRIGKRVIVSFPNFSYWRIRLHLLWAGCAPKSKQLPFEWYNTPNIRVITLRDFRKFSRQMPFNILAETAINTHHHDCKGNIVTFLPDWRATYGIFLIGKY